MDKEPNIFNYATSELSQDAFICWLLEWSMQENKNKNNDLYKSGKSFLKAILKKVGVSDDAEIIEIKKQYKSIDVLLIVREKNGAIKTIIVEDKTFTDEHSEQLERYKKKVMGHSGKDNVEKPYICQEEDLHVLYIKTGYMNEEEISKYSNINKRIGCFSYKDIDKLFNKSKNKVCSDIYNSWIDSFNENILNPINKARKTTGYKNVMTALKCPNNDYNKIVLLNNFLNTKKISSGDLLKKITKKVIYMQNPITPNISVIERKNLKFDLVEFYSEQADITFRYSFRYRVYGPIHFELTSIPGKEYMSQKAYINHYGEDKNNKYIKLKKEINATIKKLKEDHAISGLEIRDERLQTFKFIFNEGNSKEWNELNKYLPLLMNNLLANININGRKIII